MIQNKKSRFDYTILDTEIAGVMLIGSELGPLRAGKANIHEAFIFIDIDNNTVWLKNMYIKNEQNTAYSHEETRDRKLLLTKHQIEKWYKKLETDRLTIVPIKGFFDKRNRFKLEIGLGKGNKKYDKKDIIKEKDIKREIDRNLV